MNETRRDEVAVTVPAPLTVFTGGEADSPPHVCRVQIAGQWFEIRVWTKAEWEAMRPEERPWTPRCQELTGDGGVCEFAPVGHVANVGPVARIGDDSDS